MCVGLSLGVVGWREKGLKAISDLLSDIDRGLLQRSASNPEPGACPGTTSGTHYFRPVS